MRDAAYWAGRYWVAAWAIGVLLSFVLPSVPHWGIWIAGAMVLFAASQRFAWMWCLLCVLIGAAYGVLRTENALAGQWPLSESERVQLVIEVADIPRVDERKVQFSAVAKDKNGRSFHLLLSDYQKRDWAVGSRWETSAKVRPVVGEVNLRGLNREAWALAGGIDGVGTVGKGRVPSGGKKAFGIAAVRDAVSRSWQEGGGGQFSDGIGLMRALSVGEQSALRAELWQAFRPLGLTHLVSISGLHVTMVAVMFGWLTKRLLRCLPKLPARPRVWMLAAALAGALFYALLAGFSVPTQRSVLMLAAFALAWRFGSGSAWLAWWRALALVLLIDPLAALGVGSWLSFGLVGALIWAGSGRLKERGWRLAVRGQWAATVLSVVMTGYIFASLPLVSPLVNALAIPWFSWVLTPLALAGSLLPFEPLQYAAAALAEYTLQLLLWLAKLSPETGVAAAPLPLLLAAFAAALILLLPRGAGLRPWAVIVLLGFVFYRPLPVAEGNAKITVMDAGQGLSVLVQTKNRNLLFDTGTEHAARMGILPSLRAMGVRVVDRLVLSHHDDDHDGGRDAVGELAVAAVSAGQPEFYERASVCAESEWMWDGVHFEFLRPSEHISGEDNDKSCVLRVVANGKALLITGDLGMKGEMGLVERYGEGLYSQILVLGHHGSNTASSGSFLNTVRPKYAVASSGYANAYRHPTAAVQNRVRAHGIDLLRTDLSGALVFDLGEGEVFRGPVKQYKPYWQKKPFDK